jgi:hypothetical protein
LNNLQTATSIFVLLVIGFHFDGQGRVTQYQKGIHFFYQQGPTAITNDFAQKVKATSHHASFILII